LLHKTTLTKKRGFASQKNIHAKKRRNEGNEGEDARKEVMVFASQKIIHTKKRRNGGNEGEDAFQNER